MISLQLAGAALASMGSGTFELEAMYGETRMLQAYDTTTTYSSAVHEPNLRVNGCEVMQCAIAVDTGEPS